MRDCWIYCQLASVTQAFVDSCSIRKKGTLVAAKLSEMGFTWRSAGVLDMDMIDAPKEIACTAIYCHMYGWTHVL